MKTKKTKTTANPRKAKLRILAFMGVGFVALTGVMAVALRISKEAHEKKSAGIDSVLADAKLASQAERHEKVVEMLQARIQEFTNDPDALLMFAKSRLLVPVPSNYHIQIASRCYREIVKLNPDHAEANKVLFEISSKLENLDDIIKFGKRACELSPEDFDLHLRLGQALQKQGKPLEAMQFADTCIQLRSDAMEPYQLRFQSMMSMQASQDEMLQYIEDTVEAHQTEHLRSLIQYAFALALGDSDLQEVSLTHAASDADSSEQALWLVRELEARGRNDDAMQLLESVVPTEEDVHHHVQLAVRYFLAGQYDLVLKQDVEDPNKDHLVLQIISALQLQQPKRAASALAALQNDDDRFARVWADVFNQLVQPEVDGRELLLATTRALDSFPLSGYLQFFRGVALQRIGELDASLASYEKAIGLTPMWVLPRVKRAELLLDRDRYLSAFVECAESIRLNPQYDIAADTMIQSVLGMIRTDAIPTSLMSTVVQGITNLRAAATDEKSQLILQGILARLDGKHEKADQCVQQYLEVSSGKIDSKARNLLFQLASAEALREQLTSSEISHGGLRYRELLEEAYKIASVDGERAGIEYLESYGKQVQADAESVQLATAELLTRLESPQAIENWMKFARANQKNVRILELAVNSPALQDSFPARRQLVAWLKEALTEDCITWQLAEIRTDLDENSDDQAAASAVIRLSEIIDKTPTSKSAYALLATAYSRLRQPAKAIATLASAIKAGIDNAYFRIEIAEYYASRSPDLAKQHALVAFHSLDTSSAIRQRSAQVLLQLKQFKTVADLMRDEMPELLQDTDQHFEIASAVGMSGALSGRPTFITKQLAPLAAKHQRWFDLWMDITRTEQPDCQVIEELISQAEGWLETDQVARRRQLSGAWRSLASRTEQPEHWSRSLEIVSPMLQKHGNTKDWIIAARAYEMINDLRAAGEIYRRLIKEKVDETTEVILLNSIARIELAGDGDLDEALSCVQKALAIRQQPQLVASLVDILTKRREANEALKALENGVADFPENVELRIRHCNLLMTPDRVADVAPLLVELNKVAKDSADVSPAQWQRIHELEQSFLVLSDQET